jgi:hypothetical protein
MATVLANREAAQPGRRNASLNDAAWTIGHWIAAGTLEQSDLEEALYAAAVANVLVADDGERQCAVQVHRHRPLFTFIVTPPPGPLFSRPVVSV